MPCDPVGSSVFYQADFETSDDGYMMSGLWHRSSACAATYPGHDSEYGLYFGYDATCNYAAGPITPGTTTSPSIDLTDASGLVMMSFRYLLIEDSHSEAATVEVSTDGGVEWDRIAANGIVPTLQSGDGLWKCGTLNLSAYAGHAVKLRFGAAPASTSGSGNKGFFVDDIAIAGTSASQIFADGFESGDLSGWTVTVP